MDQTHALEWRDGAVPVSARFDDPFFSMTDGLAESQYVFLAGNGLPSRFEPGFHIVELGFGTGLNFLAALQAWRHDRVTGKLWFTSFEAFPLARRDLRRVLTPYADMLPVDVLIGDDEEEDDAFVPRTTGDDFDLTVILGDARTTLPNWQGKADAWFLDGFSPAKNPELWGADLMSEVATHTKARGTFATYTAAGHVRRALSDAGFAVERQPGFGRKRHMTVGRLP